MLLSLLMLLAGSPVVAEHPVTRAITIHTKPDNFTGQVCAVSPGLAYTSAHIVESAVSLSWRSQFDGGPLEVVTIDKKSDFAIVRPVGGAQFPEWHPVAKSEPPVGARLWWRGTGWYATGWYVDEGLYFGIDNDGWAKFGHAIHPSMSGGCVFDAAGTAVILVSGLDVAPEGQYSWAPPSGWGVPLWKRGKK